MGDWYQWQDKQQWQDHERRITRLEEWREQIERAAGRSVAIWTAIVIAAVVGIGASIAITWLAGAW